MGGYGSGPRSGGWRTVESGLTLDVYKLVRTKAGRVRSDESWGGSFTWSSGDRVTAEVGFIAHLREVGGHVRLRYMTTFADGSKRASDYSVELTRTPQPFGGARWWFVCPYTGEHVAKLYLPVGAWEFRSRKAYRLAYQCQRETAYDRALRQAWKTRRVLGGGADSLGEPIARRKWQHNRTHVRDGAGLRAKELLNAEHLWRVAMRLAPEAGRKAAEAIPIIRAARYAEQATARELSKPAHPRKRRPGVARDHVMDSAR